jgi:hypothetical protein
MDGIIVDVSVKNDNLQVSKNYEKKRDLERSNSIYKISIKSENMLGEMVSIFVFDYKSLRHTTSTRND